MTYNIGWIQDMYNRLLGKASVGRNVISMLIWQGANYIAPLITFPHLARVLNPSGFGQLGLALAIAGYVTIISDWGTNFSGSRQIAQARAKNEEISEIFWNIFITRIVAIFIILILTIIYIISFNLSWHLTFLIISAWTIPFGSALTVNWCLQGLERLDAFATAALIGRLFTVPATILLVSRSDHAWVAVLIQGCGGILIGCASLYLLSKTASLAPPAFSLQACKNQLQLGLPFFLSNASHGIYSTSSTVILGIVKGNQATGIFVAADRLRVAAQGLLTPISQSLYPRMSRLAVADPIRAKNNARLLIKIQCGSMAVIALFIMAFSDWIVQIIAGPEYPGSSDVLRILCLSTVISAANNVLSLQVLFPFGFQKYTSIVSIIATVFNLSVVFILVNLFSFYGAALGSFLTELFIFILYVAIITKMKIFHEEPPLSP
jgi:O-antigen/teichoic acid export membrane protein